MMMLAGCSADNKRREQLHRVAKDWCETIRASQVIPVYPLTEDVLPGDVFLVQTPIEDQQKIYAARGFLPLENMVARLAPGGYFEFYSGRYGITDDKTMPPGMWQFPPAGTDADFKSAPRAGFPSYGFSVSRSEGMNVAVPVQGIPIGMNLLNAASADGTVTIKDAYTFGLPIAELQREVYNWAALNPGFLKQFEPIGEGSGATAPSATSRAGRKKQNQDRFFLRVVNRVYLTKQVAISLFSNQATGGSASAGVPRPVELLSIGGKTDATEKFKQVNRIINEQPSAAGAAAPAPSPAPADGGAAPADGGAARAPAAAPSTPAVGGTVKVTMASSRSVSLNETFDRPLVIGYIAFDLPILAGGQLGAPVATLAQLDLRTANGKQAPVMYGEPQPLLYGIDDNTPALRAWNRDKGNHEKLIEYLAKKGLAEREIPYVLNAEKYKDLRSDIVSEFKVPPAPAPPTTTTTTRTSPTPP